MAAVVVIAIYLLPTIIAVGRKMPNTGSIVVIDILLGWTVVGWIVALAMASGDSSPRGAHVVVQNNLTNVNPSIALPLQSQRRPQRARGVIWDPMRQANIYQDRVTGRWMVEGPNGDWSPLLMHGQRATSPQTAQFPPPKIEPLPPPDAVGLRSGSVSGRDAGVRD